MHKIGIIMATKSAYFRLNTRLLSRLLQGKSLDKLNKSQKSLHTTKQLDKIVAFNLSDIGEGIREVTVKEWFVKEGDTVEQFDNLCEVQSDKASVTITSRYDGKIVKIHHKVDDIALVGNPLADFDIEEEQSSSSESSSDESINRSEPVQQSIPSRSHKVLTTPAVRRIAMENKVDLKNVPATGKLGRILKGDVLEYLNIIPAGTNKPYTGGLELQRDATVPVPKPTQEHSEVLKGVRRVMFKSMTESLKIPHFAYSDEIDMTKLVQVREELKSVAIERGLRLTFMPFFLKAASLSLLKYPILNSTFDPATETVHYKSSHNISIAMDTPDGLSVPNVKNCEAKSIFEIAKDLSDLVERGKVGRLRPNDFLNGTFSLSNIGIIGGTYTHPVIMPPQVSIGAMGKAKVVPRFNETGQIVPAHIMTVTWSADHRVIDGVTMAKFSNLWKMYLENPNLFLLDGH